MRVPREIFRLATCHLGLVSKLSRIGQSVSRSQLEHCASQCTPSVSNDRHVRHRERHHAVGCDDRDGTIGRRSEAAEKPSAVCRHHFDQSFSDETGHLVPFQIERAGIVLNSSRPRSSRTTSPGDPIAVCE
jgi:hypothetical protein